MQFILSDWDAAASAVAGRLKDELSKGQSVLWLISGGSQATYNAKIMVQIPANLTQNLSIMPADERYGPPGHDDSNWQQVIKAGFEPKQAKSLPVLQPGLSFEKTAAAYNSLAQEAFKNNQLIIGQLGIGEDGHTAGILPGSPATKQTDSWATGYETPQYQRLTLTFKALKSVSVAYALAFGDPKRQALQTLKDHNLPLSQQPAQILKVLSESYVYNDQLGDSNE